AVTGQTKTHESSIRRFIAFHTGDVLTPEAIRRTRTDLYATGAFAEVNVRVEPIATADPGARRVTVEVAEAKPLLFVYGLGYSTDHGPRGLIQLTDTNLFGRANSASIRLRASRTDQLVQFQYIDLRPFEIPWAATFSIYYERNSELRSFVQPKLADGSAAP